MTCIHSFFAKCLCYIALLLVCLFMLGFSNPPHSSFQGQISIGQYIVSVTLNSSMWWCLAGAPLRVAMDNSFLALEQFCLHQLCMHQHPSSSIGDELNYYLLLKTGVWNMTCTRVSPPLIYRHYTIYYNNYYDPWKKGKRNFYKHSKQISVSWHWGFIPCKPSDYYWLSHLP